MQDSASHPVRLIASDGAPYVVKGRQNGRMIANEQIIGALGQALGAPVADVRLIDLPDAFVRAQPELAHMPPGVSHGSKWIDGCTDRQDIAHVDVAENRERFAALAVLYSWVGAGDHQFIYQKSPPNLVHSVDHGNFPLTGSAAFDGRFDACSLERAELIPACDALQALPHGTIAEAVARPWHDWAITEDERIDLSVNLDERRGPLAAAILAR